MNSCAKIQEPGRTLRVVFEPRPCYLSVPMPDFSSKGRPCAQAGLSLGLGRRGSAGCALEGAPGCDGWKRLWLNGCGCQHRFGIPFWLVGEFITHLRTYFSGWIGMCIGTGRLWSSRKAPVGWLVYKIYEGHSNSHALSTSKLGWLDRGKQKGAIIWRTLRHQLTLVVGFRTKSRQVSVGKFFLSTIHGLYPSQQALCPSSFVYWQTTSLSLFDCQSTQIEEWVL